MKNSELISLIYEWQNIVMSRNGVERTAEKAIAAVLGSKPIKIITGFRRSGKSFLVQQLIKKRVDNGLLSRDNFLYINLEDYRLDEYGTNKHLEKIYQAFREHICVKNGKKIIAFDEIQKVKNWDKFIRTIYEKETDIEIILTGSNSELLSSELSSSLSGRFIEFNITPFNFTEYLAYHQITCLTKKELLRKEKEIRLAFHNFLKYGGLPEVFEINTHDAKLSYCSGIVNKIILDDIVKRFRVENVGMLEKMFRYIVAESGKQISFQNISKYLKQTGIYTKAETVIKYMAYLQKAFAVFEVVKFEWGSKNIFATQKKYYSIDTGLISIFRKLTDNYSFRLENVVALELYRKYKEIHFGKNAQGKEIDFIINHETQYMKIQVCQELNENNMQRETSVFSISDKYINGDNYLLTLEKNNLRIPDTVIEKNVIDWLLGF